MLSIKALLTKILLATKQIKPINSVTQITGNFKATAANTWQYTGGSLTVPAGHVYLVRAWAGWASIKPIGVGFETATTVGSKGFPSHCIENSNGLYDGGTFLLYPSTYYLFEKRAGTPTATNPYYIDCIDIDMGGVS